MISLSDQEFDSTVAHFNAEAHAVQSGALTPDYQLTNLALGVEFQPAEHDFLGNSTDKLRSKLLADTREDSALHGCHWGRRHPHGLRRTDVARKNEVEWRQVFPLTGRERYARVIEHLEKKVHPLVLDLFPLTGRERYARVIEHLEKKVQHQGMRFLDLVKKECAPQDP